MIKKQHTAEVTVIGSHDTGVTKEDFVHHKLASGLLHLESAFLITEYLCEVGFSARVSRYYRHD